jgi:hypothetical protein
MHPAVIEFVRNLPDSEFGIDPSPRAWHYASRVLAQATATAGVDEAALRVALTSWLGREIGVRFLVSLGKERAGIGGQEVIVAYPSYQALVRGWVQNGRADHLLPTLKAVEKALRSHGPTAPDSATRRHILAFAGDLQGDLRERALAMVRAHTSGDGR